MLTSGARRPPLSVLGLSLLFHGTRVPALGSFPESQFSSVLHGWQGGLARQEGSRRWGLLLEPAGPPARALGTGLGQPLCLRGHRIGPGSLVPVSHFGEMQLGYCWTLLSREARSCPLWLGKGQREHRLLPRAWQLSSPPLSGPENCDGQVECLLE